jgi:predicted transcriptional regulator
VDRLPILFSVKTTRTKNRSSIDIVRDMLFSALEEVKKTRIMYQANLNFTQLERYLSLLLECGLVACNDNALYTTTKKGQEFLKTYTNYLEDCIQIRKAVEQAKKDGHLLEEAFQKINQENSQKTPQTATTT